AGKVDYLVGLKENVILGHLVPAGTGFRTHQDSEVRLNAPVLRFGAREEGESEALEAAGKAEGRRRAREGGGGARGWHRPSFVLGVKVGIMGRAEGRCPGTAQRPGSLAFGSAGASPSPWRQVRGASLLPEGWVLGGRASRRAARQGARRWRSAREPGPFPVATPSPNWLTRRSICRPRRN